MVDVDAPAVVVENQLAFEVDKTLLGIEASLDPIPVDVTSDEGSVPVDQMLFDLELDWWMQQPEMTLGQGATGIGDPVAFALSGLAPSSPFDFFIDENLLFSGATDPSGEFAGVDRPPAAEGVIVAVGLRHQPLLDEEAVEGDIVRQDKIRFQQRRSSDQLESRRFRPRERRRHTPKPPFPFRGLQHYQCQ